MECRLEHASNHTKTIKSWSLIAYASAQTCLLLSYHKCHITQRGNARQLRIQIYLDFGIEISFFVISCVDHLTHL